MGRPAVDLTGMMFGRLTVIRRVENDTRGHACWACLCSCGKSHTVSARHLKSNQVTSCGCLFRDTMTTRFSTQRDQMIGQRFGRLTVLEIDRIENGKAHYACKCDCSKTIVVRGGSLTQGGTQSCGCYQRDQTVATSITHGLSRTSLYSIWQHMVARCYNEKEDSYHWYGARGIRVCDQWRYSVQNFFDWAMQNGYKEGLSIERVNNNGNYDPGNCKWIPFIEQGRNTRANVVSDMEMANSIRSDSRTQCDIARDFGVSQSTVSRIKRGTSWKD